MPLAFLTIKCRTSYGRVSVFAGFCTYDKVEEYELDKEVEGSDNEIIYILTNEAMPGYVKVGRTDNGLEDRMRQLDNTSVPFPFECFYAARVEKARNAEQRLHDAFADHRVSSRREFFEIAPERVASALRMVELRT